MNYTSVEIDGFDHASSEPSCVCLSCCGGAAAEEGAGGARAGLARAYEALAEHFGEGRSGADPTARLEAFAERFDLTPDAGATGATDAVRMDQSAGTVYNPADTDPGDADQGIDALIYPYQWNTLELTYSFPDSASDYTYNGSVFEALPSALYVSARSALAEVAHVAPFIFTELTGAQDADADLRFAVDNSVGTAYAYLPSGNVVGGDSWYGPALLDPAKPIVGTWDYTTFMHEVGHAMGLKHGHETSYGGAIPYEMDSMEFSIMTYRSYVGHNGGGYTNSNGDYAQSLMMLDIAALQRMYGANFADAADADDTTYTFDLATGRMFVNGVDLIASRGLDKVANSDTVFRTIWDGDLGVDTYDFSNYSTALGIDLRPGEWVDLDLDGNFQRAHLGGGNYARGHIANAMLYEGDTRSLIENAKGGSGNDVFTGNAADNTFWGNGGDDRFYNSDGDDTFHGGAGFDTLFLVAAFSSFSFAMSGSFLTAEAFGFVESVADTVEEVRFSDQIWTWQDLADLAGGTPSNTGPTAADDSASVDEDGQVSVAVLGNDTDADGDPLSISSFTGGTNGSVVRSGDSLVYTPDADFNGTDSFTYVVTDGRGGTDTATVTVTVRPVNDAPDAVADTAETDEDQAVAIDVMANDSDPDGDAFSITFFEQGAAGTVELVDGRLVYTPNGGFSGQDSFRYQITDTGGAVGTTTVYVTVNEVNVAPVAGNDTAVTEEDRSVAISVLAGDTDADGDLLSIDSFGQPSNGLVTRAGDTLIYTPDADWNGTDSFTYVVSDGRGGFDTGTVTVTVTPVDDAPVAGDDVATTEQGTAVTIDVLANDSDPEGTALTLAEVDPAANGQVAIVDGRLVYTPDAGFAGEEVLSYRVTDAGGMSATATVRITVTEPVSTMPLMVGFEQGLDKETMGAVAFNGIATAEMSDLSGSFAGDSTRDGRFEIVSLGEDFDLDAMLLRAQRGNANITVEAWDDGSLVGSMATSAGAKGATALTFGAAFDSVDRVVFTADKRFFFDDVEMVATFVGDAPEPPAPPPPAPDPIMLGFEGSVTDGFQVDSFVYTSRAKGVVSGSSAAESVGDAMAVSLTGGGDFDFERGYFTAVSGRVDLTVEAWDEGVLVGTQTARISDKRELLVELDDAIFDTVDEVRFSASGGLIADDLSFLV